MSRVDHIVSRRREDARPKRRGEPQPPHRQGDQWWRERFADLLEKRRALAHSLTDLVVKGRSLAGTSARSA